MADQSAAAVDLQRSYGTNWTRTNVTTLFEWLSIAAFNIKCLDLASQQHRSIIRNFTITGLVLSTLSGTISMALFGINAGELGSNILNGIFTVFSFIVAIYTGFIKIYQIQERLEQYIKVKLDWIVFSTAIASEFQLPIELRHDAIFLIIKNKNIYLNLLKIDIEISDSIKARANADLPHPTNLHLDVSTLPRIIMDIGIQELDDLQSAGKRNKDRYTVNAPKADANAINTIVLMQNSDSPSTPVDSTSSSAAAEVAVVLDPAPLPAPVPTPVPTPVPVPVPVPMPIGSGLNVPHTVVPAAAFQMPKANKRTESSSVRIASMYDSPS